MSAPPKRMLTTEEAAEYCGFKSVNGFKSYVAVSPVNFGANIRYDKEAALFTGENEVFLSACIAFRGKKCE